MLNLFARQSDGQSNRLDNSGPRPHAQLSIMTRAQIGVRCLGWQPRLSDSSIVAPQSYTLRRLDAGAIERT
jgi:hypothetical protein